MYLVKTSQQVGMKMAKICLLKKIQIKTNPDNATYNILKYEVVLTCDVISNLIILSATLKPALCFSSSIFRYHFFKIGVLKNFSQFTGKHLCRSFFLISH